MLDYTGVCLREPRNNIYNPGRNRILKWVFLPAKSGEPALWWCRDSAVS
jgi:hypothetical protein